MSGTVKPVEVFDMDDAGVGVPVVHGAAVEVPASVETLDIDDLEPAEPSGLSVEPTAPALVESSAEPAAPVEVMDMDDAGSVAVQPSVKAADPVEEVDPDSLEETPVELPPAAMADPVVENTASAEVPTTDEPAPETEPTAFTASDSFMSRVGALADDTTAGAGSPPDPVEPAPAVELMRASDPRTGTPFAFGPSAPPRPTSTGPRPAPAGSNTTSGDDTTAPGPDHEAPASGTPFTGSPEPRMPTPPAPPSGGGHDGATPDEHDPRRGGPRGGGGGGGGALGILAAGLVSGIGGVAKGGAKLVTGTAKGGVALASGTAGVVKGMSQTHNQKAAGERQIQQANQFLAKCDEQRVAVNDSIQSMNERIEALPAGRAYVKGLTDYANNVAGSTGVSRGAARQAAMERIHNLSDTSDPVINGLRQLADKVSSDPEVERHARAARRGMSRMEREGTHAFESMKSGLENIPDGPRKRELSDAFEERADEVATKGVENGHLSKPGSTGKDRLEEAASEIRKSMEALMEKIKEMLQNMLRALGIGKKP